MRITVIYKNPDLDNDVYTDIERYSFTYVSRYLKIEFENKPVKYVYIDESEIFKVTID